ncbi:MAG: hypothetical protein IJU89_01670 [Alphaproteobacteria bacterium]|nr:hypothetical protein [Alphaproteobacteria bacterium]
MKKILSLILGLLWALPAYAALPSGYTQLEYIQSTGTQYIDTGIYLASNMVVVVKAEQTGTSGNIFGYTQGDSGRWMLSLNATTSTATLYSDKTNVVGSFSSMPVEITCNMGTGITVNGITTNFTESATRTAPATAWLFKAQGSSATPSGRIYYFKIYQNNNLIMNLVPAKNSSGVVGLYDFVSGQFFTNSGTGEFIAGPVAEITIATTKYNESAFSPLNTALANAISVVDSVVSNTITQAASIATLQTQKQTRPNDIADDSEKCPAGKKCLLVEDASGIPHWYEIVTGRLPDGYTELEYIESTGTQYIKLPSFPNASNINVTADILQTNGTNEQIFFAIDSVQTLYTSGGSWRTWKSGASGVSLTNTSSRHLFDIKTTRSGVKYYIDGTQNTNVSATFYTSELFSARILFLGARTTNSGADYFWQGRIYSFNSECDGVVCMNLVPALNPDGKIGMYDLVGGRFYENAGTGEFIGGQPVFN